MIESSRLARNPDTLYSTCNSTFLLTICKFMLRGASLPPWFWMARNFPLEMGSHNRICVCKREVYIKLVFVYEGEGGQILANFGGVYVLFE